jgi:sigma-E factor negative regulatory protein RseA
MSEQIREQVSAFLDGELPSSETELLLKRLMRDPELRHSFGRYALIGETLRGATRTSLSLGFAARVNRAIDGEPAVPAAPLIPARSTRWWKPIAGTAVAAGVAAVAVVALQQRAVSPGSRVLAPITAQNVRAGQAKEPLKYTVPVASRDTPSLVPAARFTSYVFAHSKYSVGLGQGNLMSALLSDDQAPAAASATVEVHSAADAAAKAAVGAASPAQQPQRDTRTTP